MAGGKQSPRDKMIGMMYLVLTALLALQVSNAVLEKFVFINGTLTQLVRDTETKNVGSIQSIETEYNKKGKPAKHKALYESAINLRESTKTLIIEMDSLKKKMAIRTGGFEKDEAYPEGNPAKLVGAKDYDKVGTMMLHEEVGTNFENSLDQYVDNLNSLIKKAGLSLDDFPQLTKNGDEIELFKDDPDQNMKDFLEITFLNTPTAAGMASVSQLQTEVLEYEGAMLEAIAGKIGAEIITINTIVPMVQAESNTVTVGGTYTANLFIAASNSNMDPLMTVDGKQVEVAPDSHGIKMGKVSIPARSVGEHSFEAKISMNDTTFTEKITYNVIAPTVTFSSSTLKALYENCANGLSIQCPNCGNDYEPTISVSNGKKLAGKGVGMVEIIPTSRRAVTINVANKGVNIGKETFQVKPVPEPKIQILAGGQRADNRDFVPLSVGRSIVIQAVPDPNFLAEVPRDASYRVMSGRVIHSGGNQSFSNPNVNINGLRPGPVSIQIDQVVRRRYDGSAERVTLDSKFRSFTVR